MFSFHWIFINFADNQTTGIKSRTSLNLQLGQIRVFERPHDKTNTMICAVWAVLCPPVKDFILLCETQNQQNDLCAQAKIQISQGIRPVCSESSQCAHWVAEDPMFLHADSEDFDQIGWMPRLIWDSAGRKGHFVCFVIAASQGPDRRETG